MPQHPEFEFDIFISYSNQDNSAIPGQTTGWVDQFYKNLNLVLSRNFGQLDLVKIRWKNIKTSEINTFDNSVETEIKKSAIFICLHSASYASSTNCRRELETFHNSAPGSKSGEPSRIIHVLLDDIPADQWPKELNESNTFQFYQTKKLCKSVLPLEITSEGYKTQLQKIGSFAFSLLHSLQKDTSVKKINHFLNDDQPKKAFSIYISDVSETLRKPRKRIISELNNKGYEVLTTATPTDNLILLESEIKKTVEKADISVHLLDDTPGPQIPGDTATRYAQKQTELAMNSGKPQMIWVPAETNFATIKDENYRQFLQSLENGKAVGKNFEFIRGNKSTLSAEIIDFANHAKTRLTGNKITNGKVSVMLDAHYNDQPYAIDLGNVLLENHIQPYINPQEDDPGKNIQLMGERLSRVNKLIFLYGRVSKEWVRERMSAALELIISNNYPIKDFFIFLAPPLKEENNNFFTQKFLKVNIINNSRNTILNKFDLQPFLNDLNTSAE